jgi:hypothetical protein
MWNNALVNEDAEMNKGPEASGYHPSYSGGRDQEDHSSKPAPGK